jgi:hypothetical protein
MQLFRIYFLNVYNIREMKKKYFAPEMEEVKVEDPIVLDMSADSGKDMGACPTKTCDADTCPADSD